VPGVLTRGWHNPVVAQYRGGRRGDDVSRRISAPSST